MLRYHFPKTKDKESPSHDVFSLQSYLQGMLIKSALRSFSVYVAPPVAAGRLTGQPVIAAVQLKPRGRILNPSTHQLQSSSIQSHPFYTSGFIALSISEYVSRLARQQKPKVGRLRHSALWAHSLHVGDFACGCLPSGLRLTNGPGRPFEAGSSDD